MQRPRVQSNTGRAILAQVAVLVLWAAGGCPAPVQAIDREAVFATPRAAIVDAAAPLAPSTADASVAGSDGVPTAGRRLRFQFRDEMLSDETKKETTRIVAKRLESFGVRRFSIRVLDDQLIVETGHFAPARHKAMKRTIHQRGELVVARLDDGVSLNDPTLQAAKLPAGVRLVLEEAYHGPERYTSRRFAQTIPVAGETELEARRKLAAWCATVQLDENHRIVLGEARNGDRRLA